MKIRKRSDGADITPEGTDEKKDPPKNPRKTEVSVLIYTVILFVVALALIALSYAVMQRDIAPPETPKTARLLDADGPETYNIPMDRGIDINLDGGILP